MAMVSTRHGIVADRLDSLEPDDNPPTVPPMMPPAQCTLLGLPLRPMRISGPCPPRIDARLKVFPAIARVGPPETAVVRAGLVASQLLGLAMARYVLRLPPVVAMPADVIIRSIGDTIQRYATGRRGQQTASP